MTPRLLAERKGRPIALRWIASAVEALFRRQGQAALRINFSLMEWDDEVVARIIDTFERSREIITQSAQYFSDVSDRDAKKWFPDGIPPAYAIYGQSVFFTSAFPKFGPMCRAAMVLHESIHLVDPDSGTPEVHISEWQEPAFSQQTVEQSLHNPSAYASFAAQIDAGVDAWPVEVRWGAGRPNE